MQTLSISPTKSSTQIPSAYFDASTSSGSGRVVHHKLSSRSAQLSAHFLGCRSCSRNAQVNTHLKKLSESAEIPIAGSHSIMMIYIIRNLHTIERNTSKTQYINDKKDEKNN
ncbi:hypothetical protein ILUMI_26651 [Ignelater luminosus]|uniref:Uncharacterized protein n=1 Tax=Ignelater luminosus TaxID=2038154 RepID=A0A8K0C469_IGNLU|nr:hypothetical protein ILUMI_26651 [Ignelater luminosus]